jgi:DNA polymerase type B, organellar and viral
VQRKFQVSLYPYVMKRCPYPIGNPRVITSEQISVRYPLPWRKPSQNPYHGLLLVRVCPPVDLRLPLLPYRTKRNDLTFTLCSTCSEQASQEVCSHSEQQRSWISAYTHVELNEALRLGYVVDEVYEVCECNPPAQRADPFRHGITRNGRTSERRTACSVTTLTRF